jgi:hypothetical protein
VGYSCDVSLGYKTSCIYGFVEIYEFAIDFGF